MPEWNGRIAWLATGSEGFLFSLAPQPGRGGTPPASSRSLPPNQCTS